MTNTSIQAILMSLALFLGCAGAGGDEDGTGEFPDVKVAVGPSICLFTDENGGISPTQIECTVVVGNANASEEGVKLSVQNMLDILVLPDVCPAFGPGDRGSKRFNEAAKTSLTAEYKGANADWRIKSLSCE